MKEMCGGAGIRGSGFQKYVTTHTLRAIVTSLIIEAGHGDASVVFCTGHSDTNTLSRCHILQGTEGWKQQANICNDSHNFEQPHSDEASFVKNRSLLDQALIKLSQHCVVDPITKKRSRNVHKPRTTQKFWKNTSDTCL